MKKTLLVLALTACGWASAATITWQDGDGDWNSSNWDIDGAANQAYPYITSDAEVNNGDVVNVSNGTVNVGTLGIRARNGTFNFTGDVSITGTGSGAELERTGSNGHIYINTTGTISMDSFNIGGGGTSTWIVDQGYFIAANANALHTGGGAIGSAGDRFGVNGVAGSFSFTQLDNSTLNKTLFDKVRGGFFEIDSTIISATADDGSDGWNAVEIAALNAELAGQVVGGRYLQVADLGAGGYQVALIPEPATLGLIAASGLGVLIVRRRFMI